MNIKENMISLLERCTTALKEGSEMYADNLTAICALALAEEITKEALEITGCHDLSKYFVSIIRIRVIHWLGMEFENASDVGDIPDSFYALGIEDDSLAASHILSDCFYLEHGSDKNLEADLLCFTIRNHVKIFDFINKVSRAREVYAEVSSKAWEL